MQKIANTQELQARLQDILKQAESPNPSRQQIAAQLNELADAVEPSTKTARRGGPVAEVIIDKNYGNMLHDLERELDEVMHAYDMAASYRGGDGEKDIKEIMKLAKDLQKQVEQLAKSSGPMYKLWEAERKFLDKQGSLESYIREQQDRMGFR